MADELTDRQRELLTFIADYTTEHGFPPTIREIGDALSIHSTNGVNDHLRALERKGFIARGGFAKARGWTLTEEARAELGTSAVDLYRAGVLALKALQAVAFRPLGEQLDAQVVLARNALRKAGVR